MLMSNIFSRNAALGAEIHNKWGSFFLEKHQQKINEKPALDDIPAFQKRAIAKPLIDYRNKYEDENIAIKEAYLGNSLDDYQAFDL